MNKRKRGAQPGNRNALKSGLHTQEMRALRRQARLRIHALKAAIAQANLAQFHRRGEEAKSAGF